ncbi:MAG: leucine-rich repeat domain-containing protein [Clostridia bacterium]|nr:leucine-rich repeat domain-containing protein [Clostridia bacterium]
MPKQESKTKNTFRYSVKENGECAVFMASQETEKTVVFPERIDGYQVTEIGAGACNGCQSVETVIIPEGVRKIGMQAFRLCKSLSHIHLPSTLEDLGYTPFLYCHAISLITLPKGACNAAALQKELNFFDKPILALQGEGAGKIDENGKTGIYTYTPYGDGAYEILYEKAPSLTVMPYEKAEVDAFLQEAMAYSLLLEEKKTYDVYSSDGVDPNDVDISHFPLPIGAANLIIENGALVGLLYAKDGFEGALFFNGTSLGTVSRVHKQLMLGHPLDYYMYTTRTLYLKKSQDM